MASEHLRANGGAARSSDEICKLAVEGHFSQLVALLEAHGKKGLDISSLLFPNPASIPPRRSPFIQAAYSGRLEVLQYILTSQRPTPELLNYTDVVRFESGNAVHHCTALLAACFKGHLEAARALLGAGADPEICDCTGATPLCEAVFHGHLELVQLLHQEYGACANTPNGFGWSPLHVAIDRGHRRITDYLLNIARASVTQMTPEGYTALHIAAMRGRTDTVKDLITKLAEADVQDHQSHHGTAVDYVPLPLYLAAINSRHKVVELLLQRQDVSDTCKCDVKLLQGVVKLEQGLNPLPTWEKAFFASTETSMEPLSSLEVYGRRKEISSWQDVVRMGQQSLQDLDREKRYQALIIRERCLGRRDFELFWQLSKATITFLEKAGDASEETWLSAQRLLLRAIELVETYHLPSVERGFLLPQSMEVEIGHWVKDYLSVCLVAMSESPECSVSPGFGRFVEFLVDVFTVVKERAAAVCLQYQCDDVTPSYLFQNILFLFHLWLRYTMLPKCPSNQVSECESLGRRFVCSNLFLPDGSTLLHELISMWHDTYRYLFCKDSMTAVNKWLSRNKESNTLLLTSLLEWGAAQVINVTQPTMGNAPIHQLANAIRDNILPKTFAPLLTTMANYAHIDAVNSEGETAYDICLSIPDFGRDILVQLSLSLPPLACLCCHRILTWGVAYRSLDCLPSRLIEFIRMHDPRKQ